MTDHHLRTAAPRRSAPSPPKRVWGIIALAFALRLFVWWVNPYPGEPEEDSRQYHQLAINLISHGTLSLAEEPPPVPSGRRVPGYPLFLSLLYSTGADVRLVKLFQTLVGTATVFLVHRLAARAGLGSTGALVAALACAVLPPLVLADARLMTESLFTFLLCAAVLAAYLWADRKSFGAAVLLGVVCGGLAMIKPEAALLPVAVVAGVAGANFRKQSTRSLAAQSLVALAVAAVFVSPWLIRNALAFGRPFLISGGGEGDRPGAIRQYRLRAEHDLLFWPERHAYFYGDELDAAQARYDRAVASAPADPSQSDVEYFLRRPGMFLKYCGVRLFQLLQPVSWNEAFGLEKDAVRDRLPRWSLLGAKAALLMLDGLVLFFGLVGLAASLRPSRRRLWVLTATAAYFLAVYTVVHSLPRYRIPIYPLLIVLAICWLAPIVLRARGLRIAVSK